MGRKAIDIKETVKKVLDEDFLEWLAQSVLKMAVDKKQSHVQIIDHVVTILNNFFEGDKRKSVPDPRMDDNIHAIDRDRSS